MRGAFREIPVVAVRVTCRFRRGCHSLLSQVIVRSDHHRFVGFDQRGERNGAHILQRFDVDRRAAMRRHSLVVALDRPGRRLEAAHNRVDVAGIGDCQTRVEERARRPFREIGDDEPARMRPRLELLQVVLAVAVRISVRTARTVRRAVERIKTELLFPAVVETVAVRVTRRVVDDRRVRDRVGDVVGRVEVRRRRRQRRGVREVRAWADQVHLVTIVMVALPLPARPANVIVRALPVPPQTRRCWPRRRRRSLQPAACW